jgi:hypothetical protein
MIELTLSPLASDIWHNFRIDTEKELGINGYLADIPGWGAKLAGQVLRIAGLLQLASSSNPALERQVEAEIMQKAIDIVLRLQQHAHAAFRMMGGDPIEEDAKELLAWMLAQPADKFTATEISHGLRQRNIGKTPRRKAALAELAERNYIATVKVKGKGSKPVIWYFLHPEVVENKTAHLRSM